MKKILLTILCIIAILIILLSPQIVIDGVRQGIKLNLYSVIPSLLPFMVLTNIMLKYNLCEYISYFFNPVLSRIFKASPNGCFAIIIGFTCGYPMGAKIIGDLHTNNQISKSEACYLITFCNNCSITFLLNYILFECFGNSLSKYILILLVYLPPIITGIINKFILKPDINIHIPKNYTSYYTNPFFAAVKSISILSVYIICFTVLAKWIETIAFLPDIIKAGIAGFTEITSGAAFIISAVTNKTARLALILGCTVFGGISILFQSFEQLPDKELKKHYLIGKLEQLFIYGILLIIILCLDGNYLHLF